MGAVEMQLSAEKPLPFKADKIQLELLLYLHGWLRSNYRADEAQNPPHPDVEAWCCTYPLTGVWPGKALTPL